MKSNLRSVVIANIADTQDGGKLNAERDEYSAFIMQLIDNNTKLKDENFCGFVDVEELADNIRYAIDQLKKALKPLDAYEMPESLKTA